MVGMVHTVLAGREADMTDEATNRPTRRSVSGTGHGRRREEGRTSADEPDRLPERPTAQQGPDELGALPKHSYL
jgi:hypothetical protein